MVTALIVTFVLLILGGILLWETSDLIMGWFRPAVHSDRDVPLPFLIFPFTPQDDQVAPPTAPIGVTELSQSRATAVTAASVAQVVLEGDVSPHPTWSRTGRSTALKDTTKSDTSKSDTLKSDMPKSDMPKSEMLVNDFSPAATIAFQRPADHPVQILPGRFEVLSGENRRDDIRFIGTLGEEAELIVGRNAGPPQKVVTLRSATVSRQHAQMRFVDGRWLIANLSATNPVVVNDEILDRDGDPRMLSDGDRVELGEVVLKFHAH